VIDLSAATFCDSSGIRAHLHGRRLADARGVDYRAAGDSGIVKEALEVTGVLALLNGDTPDGQRT
jgi:anti-anti-sigma regulatory factor